MLSKKIPQLNWWAAISGSGNNQFGDKWDITDKLGDNF